MHFIKLVLLVHFLQMLYEVHALLLCYEKDIDEITHQISCIKELSDYVRTRSTTRFTHFLMMQYNDFRWIEHFRIMQKFVRQLTKKLKPLM